jgi:hypothetical protein
MERIDADHFGFISDDPRSSASSAFYLLILCRKPIADPYTQLKTDVAADHHPQLAPVSTEKMYA